MVTTIRYSAATVQLVLTAGLDLTKRRSVKGIMLANWLLRAGTTIHDTFMIDRLASRYCACRIGRLRAG